MSRLLIVFLSFTICCSCATKMSEPKNMRAAFIDCYALGDDNCAYRMEIYVDKDFRKKVAKTGFAKKNGDLWTLLDAINLPDYKRGEDIYMTKCSGEEGKTDNYLVLLKNSLTKKYEYSYKLKPGQFSYRYSFPDGKFVKVKSENLSCIIQPWVG